MGCSNLLSGVEIGRRYLPDSDSASAQFADFGALITSLQMAVISGDVERILGAREALTTTCPIILNGLAADAGRLSTLDSWSQGLVLAVVWMLVRAEVTRFATQRARRYHLPEEDCEAVIAKTEEKLIERLQSADPPTFDHYGQFAAYINTATTNTAISAYTRLANRPAIGSLSGKDDMLMRPVSGRWPKPKASDTKKKPADPEPPSVV